MIIDPVEIVSVQRRRIVREVVVGNVDDFRRENFRRRRQICREFVIDRVHGPGITRIIRSVHRVLRRMEDAGIIAGDPVRLVLDADVLRRNAIGPVGVDGIIPILCETRVVEGAVGIGGQRPAVANLAVAFQKRRRRPRTHVDRDRMAQNPVGIANNVRGGGIKCGERRLVTIPVAEAQKRKVQTGEGVGVKLHLVRMGAHPSRVKRDRAAQPLNGLIHFGCVNGRHRWRRRRAVGAVVKIGHRERVTRCSENEFINVQSGLAPANLKRLRQTPRVHREPRLAGKLRQVDPFPDPAAQRAASRHDVRIVVETRARQVVHQNPIRIYGRGFRSKPIPVKHAVAVDATRPDLDVRVELIRPCGRKGDGIGCHTAGVGRVGGAGAGDAGGDVDKNWTDAIAHGPIRAEHARLRFKSD